MVPSREHDDATYFESAGEVPTHAITQGLTTILRSEKILLLASGYKKAEAIQRLVAGKISENFPASYLWHHQQVTVLVDQAAYSLVKNHAK